MDGVGQEGLLGLFAALEQSGFGRITRSSPWLYPLANVVHVLALTVFASAVAIMDLRLAGAFAAIEPQRLIRDARRVAIAAFAVLFLSGTVLFTAEAGKLAANPVFLTKLGLILAALANVLAFELLFTHGDDLPRGAKTMGVVSIVLWLCVASAGRLIAYY